MNAGRINSALLMLLTSAAVPGVASQPDRLSVPNSSFEESNDEGESPRAWTFQGPPEAMAAAWTKETPFDGNRALRINARRGSQHWQSKAIELPSHREYLLTWKTRFQGEKNWRFRADFSGAEIVIQDEQGRPLDGVRAHSSCWQTLGWQSAWLHVTAPNKAKFLVIRFGIDTDDSLPGGFDVDTVELVRWPQTSTESNLPCLNLQVHDENRLPTAARLRAVSPQGTAVWPIGSINYRIGGAFHPLDEGV